MPSPSLQYVYFIQAGQKPMFKIGFSKKDPDQRLASLQTGAADVLRIFDYIETPEATRLEKYLHYQHVSRRSRGEWFEFTPEEMTAVIVQAEQWQVQDQVRRSKVDALADLTAVDDKLRDPDEHTVQLLEKLLDINAQLNLFQFAKQEVEDELKLLIGHSTGIDGIATWKVSERQRINTKKLEQEHPDLAERYRETTIVRAFRSKRTLPNKK